MPVIGYLNASGADGYSDELRSLRQGFKESGYVEGENVAIEYRWAENQADRLPVLAADLVRRHVSVIAAASAPASVVAAKATSTIPIVFLVPEDPVRLGLVTSLARPGGNATGINFFAAELAAKRLELLRTLAPAATRVAALLNPAEPTIYTANLRDVEAAASAMGLQLRLLNASTIADIDAAFATFASDRPDALFIAAARFSPTGASNLPTSRRATPSPRLARGVSIPKSAG
jgi:putative ABC transport system substrate-binding protein